MDIQVLLIESTFSWLTMLNEYLKTLALKRHRAYLPSYESYRPLSEPFLEKFYPYLRAVRIHWGVLSKEVDKIGFRQVCLSVLWNDLKSVCESEKWFRNQLKQSRQEMMDPWSGKRVIGLERRGWLKNNRTVLAASVRMKHVHDYKLCEVKDLVTLGPPSMVPGTCRCSVDICDLKKRRTSAASAQW